MAAELELDPAAKRKRTLMKLVVFGIPVVALSWWGTSALLGMLNPATATEPHVYSSPEQGYTVTFPGEPESSVASYPVGEQTVEETTVAWAGTDSSYAVVTSVLPEELVPADEGAYLEAVLDTLRSSIPEQELREKNSSVLDGESALTGLISSADYDLWYTLAMHNSTHVMLTVAVPPGEASPAFADSFSFLD